MTRYGYHDMPENYSDIGTQERRAVCPTCCRRWFATVEETRKGQPDGPWFADDMCSEYDGERVDTRSNEW